MKCKLNKEEQKILKTLEKGLPKSVYNKNERIKEYQKIAKAARINQPRFATTEGALEAWQIEEIKKGIAEADAGDLINHSEILKRWGHVLSEEL